MLTLEQINYKNIANYKNLLDLVYPIGALYISFEPASPANLFGGTWIQMTTGVLRASNNTVTAGSDDMIVPYHNHSASSGTQSVNHSHTVNNELLVWEESGGTKSYVSWTPNLTFGWSSNRMLGPSTDKYRAITTSIESTKHTHSVTVNYAGSSVTEANLPRYQNVYVWRRTA